MPAASIAWTTLVQEFSDIADPASATRVLVRLFLAMLIGGLIGYERERTHKAAGLRTHMLVALGAALFVLAPLEAGVPVADMSRVIQGVVAGIGFLGAGAIIKLDQDYLVRGLTTAASIWMAAALGVAAGMGRGVMALLAALAALFILSVLHRVERHRPLPAAHAEARRAKPGTAGQADSGPGES